jgi:hypothetical protein
MPIAPENGACMKEDARVATGVRQPFAAKNGQINKSAAIINT